MRVLPVLLLCSCTAPSFITQSELRIYDQNNKVRREDLDVATDLVIYFLKEAKPNIYNDDNTSRALEGVVVRVSSELVPCPSNTGKCEGLANINGMIYKHNDCIAKTAFVHEIIHILRARIEGDMDAEHADMTLFGWGSVEARVYVQLKCANKNILYWK